MSGISIYEKQIHLHTPSSVWSFNLKYKKECCFCVAGK